MVEEKLEKEENLIEIRIVEEIVPKRFYKYLKVFEKKESERMLIRKTWDYTINLKEVFVLKKEKIYPLSRIEREKVQEFLKDQLRKRYIWPSKSPQTSSVFFVAKEEWKEEDDARLLMSEQLDNQE